MASDPSRSVRVLTWNLQGSSGVDTRAVADVITRVDADIVMMQEIQRGQASRLAAAVDMPGHRWAFKHWAIIKRAEGAAVLSAHRLVSARSFVLRREPFWTWRRRVALETTFERDGKPFTAINIHLSAHDDGERRRHEAGLVLARSSTLSPAPVIGGDLNDSPGGPGYEAFVTAGWVDAWRAVHGNDDLVAGATNWTAGDRLGRPPTQRLDYVFAPPGWFVESCNVAVDAARLDDASALSDHLPVAATLRPPAPEGSAA
jgi:endonuclease/exonuclease/phosphatase family metal-dependent hydrolase